MLLSQIPSSNDGAPLFKGQHNQVTCNLSNLFRYSQFGAFFLFFWFGTTALFSPSLTVSQTALLTQFVFPIFSIHNAKHHHK